MIEYIFFDTALRQKFVEYADSLGINCALHDDLMGWVVEIPEDISEAQDDALEARYELLQQEQAQLLMQTEGGFRQVAGFRYTLPDGQARMAAIPTATGQRLLSVLSLEEIQELFASVARSALSDDNLPLCKSQV